MAVHTKVSVIMAAQNSQDTLQESINSVREQTMQNFELIIVNDSSKDQTLNIAHKMALIDSRIKLINLGTPVGVSCARNTGIRASVGEYVAFIDSDDLWDKGKLKAQICFMQENKCNFSFGDYNLINIKGNIIGKRFINKNLLNHSDLLGGNKIGLLTVAISTKVAKEFLFPDIHHEDYALWLLITKRGIVAQKYSNSIFAYYRKHDSLSSNKLKSAIWTWKIYREIEKENIFQSILHISQYIFMNLFNIR